MKNDGNKTRFSLSIDPALVGELDGFVARCGFPSRSQAVTEIIRDRLAERLATAPDAYVVGTITLIYDHHKRNLCSRLTDIQHDNPDLIRSALHIHASHDLCMEVIAVCGPSAQIREMADRLITVKGVLHGKLAVGAVEPERHHQH
jgi:CopG family nickel-responsive transcriptional regulator